MSDERKKQKWPVAPSRSAAPLEFEVRRIAELRFGIKLIIEKAQYDEYDGAWRLIVQLGNEILAADDLLAQSETKENHNAKQST